jgi:CubicO group peptidase (beta-lactamase class C family)
MKTLFCILVTGWMTASVDGIAAAQAGFPANNTIQRWIDQRVAGKSGVGIVLATRNAAGETKVFSAGDSGRTGLALNEHTVFEIGSITKTFTTALLADMVARGEVKLDDPVSGILPPSLKPPGRGDKQITLVDLATHSSGLPILPTNIKPRSIANPYADYSVTMFSEFLVHYELPREIGASYEYSAVALVCWGTR